MPHHVNNDHAPSNFNLPDPKTDLILSDFEVKMKPTDRQNKPTVPENKPIDLKNKHSGVNR